MGETATHDGRVPTPNRQIRPAFGLDPAVYLGTSFEAPTTPIGFDELTIGGSLRGEGVRLVDCLTVDQKAIAPAEIVIEGEILPEVRVAEDQNTRVGTPCPSSPVTTGPPTRPCR